MSDNNKDIKRLVISILLRENKKMVCNILDSKVHGLGLELNFKYAKEKEVEIVWLRNDHKQ